MGHALKNPAEERRKNERDNILKIPACFVKLPEGKSLYLRIVNLSKTGLGVESQEFIAPGSEVQLITVDQKPKFCVTWSNREDRNNSYFIYTNGLVLLDKKIDLPKMFECFLLNTDHEP